MTENNAFSFGAQERSWWSMSLDPEVQAERRALAEEKAQLVANMEQEQRLQEQTQFTGPGLLMMIQTCSIQNQPAETEKVQAQFQEAFPGADFRQALEVLKREGMVHEIVSGPAGFMGARTTRLYLLEG